MNNETSVLNVFSSILWLVTFVSLTVWYLTTLQDIEAKQDRLLDLVQHCGDSK